MQVSHSISIRMSYYVIVVLDHCLYSMDLYCFSEASYIHNCTFEFFYYLVLLRILFVMFILLNGSIIICIFWSVIGLVILFVGALS